MSHRNSKGRDFLFGGEDDEIQVAEVRRHGEHIVVPEDMDLDDAIEVLEKVSELQEQTIQIHETIPGFVWDAAIALQDALKLRFGWSIPKRGAFGDAPHQIGVETADGTTVQVAWGRFDLPGTRGGIIETDVAMYEGRIALSVTVAVARKYEKAVHELIALTREIVSKKSIYRGQAIEIAFRDESGRPLRLPTPRFLKLSSEMVPVFKRELEESIEAYILTPIRYSDKVKSLGVPLKRGVLLAGPYGTGKTLAAQQIAAVAIENGWTFLYIRDVAELPDALKFAVQYQPCIVFAEDVDRIAGSERTDEVNTLLNTLDGVDNKGVEIMTVMTTNHGDRINKAMMRPGRVDVVLHVDPPDREAAIRLVRKYAGELLSKTENLDAVGEELAEQIPAVIREVVERAKLEAVMRTSGSGATIVAKDLLSATKVMKREKELLGDQQDEMHPVDRLGSMVGSAFGETLGGHLKEAVAAMSSNNNGHKGDH